MGSPIDRQSRSDVLPALTSLRRPFHKTHIPLKDLRYLVHSSSKIVLASLFLHFWFTQMASDRMICSIGHHLRIYLPADFHSERTSGIEAASLWHIDRAWDFSFRVNLCGFQSLLCFGDHRNRRQQHFRVRMLWILEKSSPSARFQQSSLST